MRLYPRNSARAIIRAHQERNALLLGAMKKIAKARNWAETIEAIAESLSQATRLPCLILATSPAGNRKTFSYPRGSFTDEANDFFSNFPTQRFSLIQRLTLNNPISSKNLLRSMRARRAWVFPLIHENVNWGTIMIASDMKGPGIGFIKEFAELSSFFLANAWNALETEEMLDARDEFLLAASHELRTPVTILRLQAHAIRKLLKGLSKELIVSNTISQLLDVLDRQAIRIDRIVENLLTAARAKTGEFNPLVNNLDLCSIIRKVVHLNKLEFQLAGSEPNLELPDHLWGYWDPNIEKPIESIIGNAIRFGRGKPIHIKAWRENNYAKLSVRDFGPGVAINNQNRLFKRFERGGPAKEFAGFGLGMFLSQWIISGHHGKIEVQSRPGEGAKFTITLPFVPHESIEKSA